MHTVILDHGWLKTSTSETIGTNETMAAISRSMRLLGSFRVPLNSLSFPAACASALLSAVLTSGAVWSTRYCQVESDQIDLSWESIRPLSLGPFSEELGTLLFLGDFLSADTADLCPFGIPYLAFRADDGINNEHVGSKLLRRTWILHFCNSSILNLLSSPGVPPNLDLPHRLAAANEDSAPFLGHLDLLTADLAMIGFAKLSLHQSPHLLWRPYRLPSPMGFSEAQTPFLFDSST